MNGVLTWQEIELPLPAEDLVLIQEQAPVPVDTESTVTIWADHPTLW